MSQQHNRQRYYWTCARSGCGWPNTELDLDGRHQFVGRICRKCGKPGKEGKAFLIATEEKAQEDLQTYYLTHHHETFQEDYVLTTPPKIPYGAPSGNSWQDYTPITTAEAMFAAGNEHWELFVPPENMQGKGPPQYSTYDSHQEYALTQMSPEERSFQAQQVLYDQQLSYNQPQHPFDRQKSSNQPQSHYGQQPPSTQPQNLPAPSYYQSQTQPQRNPMPPPSAPDIEFVNGGVVPRRGEKRKPRDPPASSGGGFSGGRKKRH